MCGRFDLNETGTRVKRLFALRQLPLLEPKLDLRPTDTALVVRLDSAGEREAGLMRWGFVPPFARDGKDRINARGESVGIAYRDAYTNRRCLVPASAFHEWSGEKGRKIKWRIAVRDAPVFAFAGLWDWRAHDGADESAEAFTIITTEPNDILMDIHDRMPVIVAEENYDEWLQTGARELLRPFPSKALEVAPA